MTVDEIGARVAYIGDIRGDDEAAHSAEDELWEAVLEAIANGAPDAAGLAGEALKTRAIKFSRWYA